MVADVLVYADGQFDCSFCRDCLPNWIRYLTDVDKINISIYEFDNSGRLSKYIFLKKLGNLPDLEQFDFEQAVGGDDNDGDSDDIVTLSFHHRLESFYAGKMDIRVNYTIVWDGRLEGQLQQCRMFKDGRLSKQWKSSSLIIHDFTIPVDVVTTRVELVLYSTTTPNFMIVISIGLKSKTGVVTQIELLDVDQVGGEVDVVRQHVIVQMPSG